MLYVEYPLLWNQDVVDKIQNKHRVNPEEVEEVIFGGNPFSRKGKRGTHIVMGKTFAGRYLLIVLGKRPGRGKYKVITARPMAAGEIRQFRRQQL